jgi:ribose/xylose/arabinose/galactoside ABC-type transport system permease subunit
VNTTVESPEWDGPVSETSRRSLWSRFPESLRPTIPLVIAIVVLGAVATSRSSDFLTTRNMQNLLEQVAVLGVLSVGATFLMAAGLLDLSVGSGATLVTIICAKLLTHGNGEAVAILGSLGLGLFIGLITGTIVAVTRVAPFILTLGGLSVLSSIALIASDQQPISVGLHLAQLDLNKFLGIPLPFWVFLGSLVIGAAVLRFTRLGRNAYAVGSNEEAAYLSGVAVGPVKTGLYAINGVMVGLAGLLLVARLGSGDPNAGAGLELQAIAAVVLGGATLAGGRGTMIGTFLGVMLLGVISNSLTIAGVQSFYQSMVQGGVLIIAVVTTALLERRRNTGVSFKDALLGRLLKR